jgi:uncharacterized protein
VNAASLAMILPALLMGVLGSAHCAVMCGGVAAAACGRPKASITFNLGRVATYALLGAIAGAFGAMSTIFAVALRPLAAIALLGLGLHLAGITNVFTTVEKLGLPLWRKLAPLTQRPLHATVLGAVWGFVPCGLVYAALAVAASTGSAVTGALAMLAFGAGTLPVMTLIGAVAGSLVMRFLARPLVRRTAGLFVLVLGVHQTTLAFAAVDLDVTGQSHVCHHGRR